VLAAAIHLNKLMAGHCVRRRSASGEPAPDTELEVVGEMAAALRGEARPPEALARLLVLARARSLRSRTIFVFDGERRRSS
jgi:hypothetical protein